MRFALKVAFLIAAVLGLSACPKTPLRENRAVFDLASSHWFETEKTQYVFFSISGLRTAQAKLTWPFAFEISGMGTPIPGLNAKADGFALLDLSKGVFQHHFVECGDGRICGSFSFHAAQPIQQVLVRFRYNSASEMQEVASLPVATHPAGQGPDSQSALVYGVYNHDNSRLQLRVHDNFGTPDSEQVLQYGMNRNFTADGIQSVSLSTQDEFSGEGGNYIFPADICTARSRNGQGTSFTFGGHDGWTPTAYDPNETQNDACFRASMLDQTGQVLTTAPGLARKNPVLAGEPLTLQPPVKETIDIPIIVSYCPDAPGGDLLTDPNFLRYQKYILGYDSKFATDLCFQSGQESQFQLGFTNLLTAKLRDARTKSGSLGRDFFFRVIINHRMPSSGDGAIRQFHQMMSAAIRAKLASEILMQTPRLVGAFVYDSRPSPDVDTGGNVIWCPRDPNPNGTQDLSDPTINCTPQTAAGKVSLGPFNFQIPMGPFPTIDAFLKNFNQVGDRGESNNPQLTVSSVQTTGVSTTTAGPSNFATFFDNQRLDFSAGERLKLCTDRDTDGLFSNMVFKYSDPHRDQTVMSLQDAQNAMLYPGANGATVGSMLVGLQWTNPFIGTFSYSIPVKGTVFSVIPISVTGKTTQNLGDPLWSKPVWNMTPMMQKCLRNCEHPGFDEAGIYQVNSLWNQSTTCVTPKTAEP